MSWRYEKIPQNASVMLKFLTHFFRKCPNVVFLSVRRRFMFLPSAFTQPKFSSSGVQKEYQGATSFIHYDTLRAAQGNAVNIEKLAWFRPRDVDAYTLRPWKPFTDKPVFMRRLTQNFFFWRIYSIRSFMCHQRFPGSSLASESNVCLLLLSGLHLSRADCRHANLVLLAWLVPESWSVWWGRKGDEHLQRIIWSS